MTFIAIFVQTARFIDTRRIRVTMFTTWLWLLEVMASWEVDEAMVELVACVRMESRC